MTASSATNSTWQRRCSHRRQDRLRHLRVGRQRFLHVSTSLHRLAILSGPTSMASPKMGAQSTGKVRYKTGDNQISVKGQRQMLWQMSINRSLVPISLRSLQSPLGRSLPRARFNHHVSFNRRCVDHRHASLFLLEKDCHLGKTLFEQSNRKLRRTLEVSSILLPRHGNGGRDFRKQKRPVQPRMGCHQRSRPRRCPQRPKPQKARRLPLRQGSLYQCRLGLPHRPGEEQFRLRAICYAVVAHIYLSLIHI